MDTRRLFDEIAPTYDRLNRLLSLGLDRGWRRQAVRALAPHKPKLILDVATGSGDLAIAALSLNPDAVTAVDVSPGMLSRAAAKIAGIKDGGRIALLSAAAEALPFADNSFDAVCVAFGARNFADLDKGLGEIFRVLKPGGVVVVLEFSRPRNPLLRRLHRFYLLGPLPLLGGFVSGNRAAYVHLGESVLAFPHGEEFSALLARAGFSATACRRLSLGVCSLYCGVK